MSAGVTPDASPQAIEQERRRIGRHLDEVGRLAESEAPASTFFGEMLKRLLDALAAPAGAVWMFTANGNLQLQFHINLPQVGLDKTETSRQAHEELLRLAVTQPRPIHLLPQSGLGTPAAEGKVPPGNPTDFMLLLVPVLQGDKVLGLLEVWQGPNRPLNAVPGFLQYMGLMADLCARYLRHQRMGQLADQQQLWTQLEAFARQVHGSLKPIEVAYSVANEGRRLVDCDRVCVALRQSGSTTIEAVSGADVVEKRSALIKLMRRLADKVIHWGEKLVFTGTKDDSLPPAVLDALDAYLAESNSKLLVVLPLRDERDKDSTAPARAALVMECFEPPEDPQQLLARLETISRHAAPALYNAVEYRRIPLRFLWMPLAKLQSGVGGPTKALMLLIVVALVSVLAAALVVPYPLKMEATGQLLPQTRCVLYAPEEGFVLKWDVRQGDTVDEGRKVGLMRSTALHDKIRALRTDIANANREAEEASAAEKNETDQQKRATRRSEAEKQRSIARVKKRELDDLVARTNADPNEDGIYYLQAPSFSSEEASRLNRREWTVLTPNFREEWTGRSAKPSDPLLRLGAKDGPWEIELKIPQKHIGQVLHGLALLDRPKKLRLLELQAEADGKPFDPGEWPGDRLDTVNLKPLLKEGREGQKGQKGGWLNRADPNVRQWLESESELDVDFLLRSDPTRTFKGKLAGDRIAKEANPNKEGGNEEAEPVVLAYVRIEGDDIPADARLPRDLLLSGAEVKAKIRCGDHPVGYSLLYGVWEFFYEKVVFFF